MSDFAHHCHEFGPELVPRQVHLLLNDGRTFEARGMVPGVLFPRGTALILVAWEKKMAKNQQMLPDIIGFMCFF